MDRQGRTPEEREQARLERQARRASQQQQQPTSSPSVSSDRKNGRGKNAFIALGVVIFLLIIGIGVGSAFYINSKEKSSSQTMPGLELLNVVIPEGLTRTEVASRLPTAQLRQGCLSATKKAAESFNFKDYRAPASVNTLEGFLFPDSYEIHRSDSADRLVEDQLTTFAERFDSVDLTYARNRNLTPYDVLIIASLIEREVSSPKERKLVAAVIYNRLHNQMQLGIDATIRYATRNWQRPLTNSELRIRSPYNTRIHRGLPPTPIGNPGLGSLEAAANPAKVDYLYYVVKPGSCGEHTFSSSFEQFQKDAAHYAKERSNQGRSPVKC